MFKQVILQNIRVFRKNTFSFNKGINLIVGKNGSGKTTILESLALFSFGRFQSIQRDQMAIRSGKKVARVEAQIIQNDFVHTVELGLTPSNKIMKIDDKKFPASQMVGIQRSVLFNPETIDLVSGPPQIRRRELDLTIAQKYPAHIKILLEYRRVLRQRNELLKRIAMDFAQINELDFWDKQLAERALSIVKKRRSFIKKSNQLIDSIYKRLLGRDLPLSLSYIESTDYNSFLDSLRKKRGYDIKTGLTSLGPHRDDFCFETDRFRLEEGASRGEQRLAAFAFKLVERDYLTDGNRLPVLLMDDVFSELDSDRREMVTEVLDGGLATALGTGGTGQIIVTATDEKVVPSIIREKGKTITL